MESQKEQKRSIICTLDDPEDLILRCLACGGEARISGRCANARVTCKECGFETTADLYIDQIEKAKDEMIKRFEMEGK